MQWLIPDVHCICKGQITRQRFTTCGPETVFDQLAQQRLQLLPIAQPDERQILVMNLPLNPLCGNGRSQFPPPFERVSPLSKAGQVFIGVPPAGNDRIFAGANLLASSQPSYQATASSLCAGQWKAAAGPVRQASSCPSPSQKRDSSTHWDSVRRQAARRAAPHGLP